MTQWYETAFLELWKQLLAMRVQNRDCALHVNELKNSCAKGCGKRHVVECPECYVMILKRMKLRFADAPDREWFTSYPDFLKDLDRIFERAKENRTDLKAVETLIEEARCRWYSNAIDLSQVGRALELEMGRLPETLLPEGVSTEGLEKEISDELAKAVDKPINIGEFLAKVEKAPSEKELRELYCDVFFRDPDGKIPDGAQKYIDLMNSGVQLEKVMDQLRADAKVARVQEQTRDEITKRLGHLKRAQTADKARKAKALKEAQEKRKAEEEKKRKDSSLDMPPCAVCSKQTQLESYYPCAVCAVYYYYFVKNTVQVYCSEECMSKGQPVHIAEAHKCAAGAHCLRLSDKGKKIGYLGLVRLCKECLAHTKNEAMYCSARCASLDFQRHRDSVHLPSRRTQGRDIKEDWGSIVYENPITQEKYRPDNINRFIWTAQEALDRTAGEELGTNLKMEWLPKKT